MDQHKLAGAYSAFMLVAVVGVAFALCCGQHGLKSVNFYDASGGPPGKWLELLSFVSA